MHLFWFALGFALGALFLWLLYRDGSRLEAAHGDDLERLGWEVGLERMASEPEDAFRRRILRARCKPPMR